MRIAMRWFAVIFVVFSLGACSTFDAATRSASLDGPGYKTIQPSFNVTEVNVEVPRDLTVSEANVYYPVADIVWRGDPPGDRYQQIDELLTTAVTRGADRVNGSRPVILDIEVTRFHAVSEKARYSVGGVHSVRFLMTVRDANSGQVLISDRPVDAELTALAGSNAIAADARGETQKVRISSNVSQVIERELTSPVRVAVSPSETGA